MELLSIFTQIGEWLKDQANAAVVAIAISFISGLFVKKGWSVMIDKFSQKAKVISKEIGETFLKGADFFEKIDQSIHDDGSIDQNSLKEALAVGKEVVIEGKDVIAVFKPKKALPAKPVVAENPSPPVRPKNKLMRGRKGI